MIVAVAGDVHGQVSLLYDKLRAEQERLGEEIGLVLQVGDFGIWSYQSPLDKATQRHGIGEFPDYLAQGRGVPIRTFFCKGNHEDQDLLFQYSDMEIVPNLRHLPNGTVEQVHTEAGSFSLGVLGGNWGSNWFDADPRRIKGARRRHFLRGEVNRLRKHPGLDVVIMHDGPSGTGLGSKGRELGVPLLRELIEQIQPSFCFFGHHHRGSHAVIGRTRVFCLSAVSGDAPFKFLSVEAESDARISLVD